MLSENRVTHHAQKRINQRVARTNASKLFNKALEEGYPPKSYSGSFRRFLDKECMDFKSHAVVYKGHIYFYKPADMLMTTVYQIPQKFRKYKAYEEKTPTTMEKDKK